MRKRAFKIYKWFLIIGMSYALFMFATGMSLPCVWDMQFGVKCAGCGMTRMFKSMFRFDFISAFFYNPFMFIMFFGWNIAGALCLMGKMEKVKPRSFRIAAVVCLIASAVFSIIRNFISV